MRKCNFSHLPMSGQAACPHFKLNTNYTRYPDTEHPCKSLIGGNCWRETEEDRRWAERSAREEFEQGYEQYYTDKDKKRGKDG
jgi:hypothetical protein